MTFLPHDKMILTSKGVTYNIIFSKANKYLHGLLVIFIGALINLATIVLWQIKMEFEYNGFQLLNLMLRWSAKILLFGDNNGWNYYFLTVSRSYTFCSLFCGLWWKCAAPSMLLE